MNCQLPHGITEADFLRDVERVAALISKKFEVPGYTSEDIKQQVALLCLEALPRYDPAVGPLVNFMYRNAHNRMQNLLRATLGRTDFPCKICHEAATDGGPGHPDGSVCPAHIKWWERNSLKAGIARAREFSAMGTEGHWDEVTGIEPSVEADAATDELLAIIDEHLPVKLRANYLRMRAGVQVPKPAREEVERAVLEILADSGLEPEDLGLTHSGGVPA